MTASPKYDPIPSKPIHKGLFVSLGVFAFNPRAQRVYTKCGFIQEGIEREALFWNGQWVDQIIMSVLSTDTHLVSSML